MTTPTITGAAPRTVAWLDRAACVDHDPETWFPVALESGFTSGRHPQVRAAVRICMDCPVRRQCLQWADDNGIRHGIWGGRTPQERSPRHDGIRLARCRSCRQLYDSNGGRRSYCSVGCRPTGGRPWTEQETTVVAQLAAAGCSDVEIGRRLGRTRSSVCGQRAKRGIPAGLNLTPQEV